MKAGLKKKKRPSKAQKAAYEAWFRANMRALIAMTPPICPMFNDSDLKGWEDKPAPLTYAQFKRIVEHG